MATLIVDGNHMAHRARYAYDLSYRGKDVSVLYGCVRMLMSYAQKYRPDAIIIGWDYGVPAYRRQLWPKYKANRHHDLDASYLEFINQMRELSEILPYLGIVQLRRQGIEADDLVYHASRLVRTALVVSGDADLLQCVSPSVSVLKPGDKEIIIDQDNFEQVVGVAKAHYVLCRALQGDSSDNIPGCPGIGEKTARKLIKRAADPWDVAQLVKAANKAQAQSLREYYYQGDLDSIYALIDLEHDLAGARRVILDYTWQAYQSQIVIDWCLKLGFVSLIQAGSIGAAFGGLGRPALMTDCVPIPLIWDGPRAPES